MYKFEFVCTGMRNTYKYLQCWESNNWLYACPNVMHSVAQCFGHFLLAVCVVASLLWGGRQMFTYWLLVGQTCSLAPDLFT